MRIGDLLMKEGLISKEQLDQALLEQKQNGTRVGYNLVKLGFVPEVELTKMLAKQYKLPAVDLSKFQVDAKIVKLIPGELAVKHLVLPLKRDGRTLTVAMADPTNMGVIEDLKFITRYDVFPVIAGEFTIKNILEKIFESTEAQLGALMKSIEASEDDQEVEVVEEKEEEMSAAALAAAVDDAPVVKLLNGILTDAERTLLTVDRDGAVMSARAVLHQALEPEVRVILETNLGRESNAFVAGVDMARDLVALVITLR